MSFKERKVKGVTNSDSWKVANVSVKKKREREKLTGFTCPDCAPYFKSLGIEKEEALKIIQKCSKHRATVPPPPKSPKVNISL